jgi:D-lyxose ketol-isomerase
LEKAGTVVTAGKKGICSRTSEQYTIYPSTKHRCQPGAKEAVAFEFSTSSHDQEDIFTDHNVKRTTKIQ